MSSYAGEKILFEGDTEFGHYQVVDMTYIGRRSRLLFSGNRGAAQSGLALDDNPELLFDYNQRCLELIRNIEAVSILLIGGGAYTLPVAILDRFKNAQTDVVEIDEGLDELARKFFGLKDDPRLRIIHRSGEDFLKANVKKYDLVIVDAFVHNIIPAELIAKKAIKQIYESLAPKGVVALNVIGPMRGPHASIVRKCYESYRSIFKNVQVYPADQVISEWISQNFLVIADKNKKRINYDLRFPPVLIAK